MFITFQLAHSKNRIVLLVFAKTKTKKNVSFPHYYTCYHYVVVCNGIKIYRCLDVKDSSRANYNISAHFVRQEEMFALTDKNITESNKCNPHLLSVRAIPPFFFLS